MKEIRLTQGKITLVDDEDFERLSMHKWYADPIGRTYYAARNKDRKKQYMHREILCITDGPVDHFDSNGLNNQKSNLRSCSQSQNVQKQVTRAGKFQGVFSPANGSKCYARIKVKYETIYLGSFVTETEAALAYNKAAVKHFGEFAKLNKVA